MREMGMRERERRDKEGGEGEGIRERRDGVKRG